MEVVQLVSGADGTREAAGHYIYCVLRASETISLGRVGIEGREVHSVVGQGITALVHECAAQPYQSRDPNVVAGWVVAHHAVVETAWRRWGAVLPFTFNSIIKEELAGQANLKAWLETECDSLQARLSAVDGKAEYGVQVFWDPAVIGMRIAETSPAISMLKEEIASRPRGLAYMYRQKLERLLKEEMEARARDEFQALYGRIGLCVDALRIERTKGSEEGLQMLMNLSCLLPPEKHAGLEAELREVGKAEGYSVRLAGPFPPYSFC